MMAQGLFSGNAEGRHDISCVELPSCHTIQCAPFLRVNPSRPRERTVSFCNLNSEKITDLVLSSS